MEHKCLFRSGIFAKKFARASEVNYWVNHYKSAEKTVKTYASYYDLWTYKIFVYIFAVYDGYEQFYTDL